MRKSQDITISDCFKEVLYIGLDDHDLAAFKPSTMQVKGVFGDKEENFVFYDFGMQECLIFGTQTNRVERIFEIPKHDGWGESHLLEVVSLDSILYFDYEHQSLVICNAEKVKSIFPLKMDKEHHQSHQIVQHFHRFLRSMDGYIGFNTWIDYGAGGENVNYDSLMDERNMVIFFKPEGDSLISRDIPLKPSLKRTTYFDLMYVDNPFFEVNTQSQEVLVFHSTTDTMYTYNWESKQIKKHVISGSKIKLSPPKVPRRGSAADILAMYENQDQGYHLIYFDSFSGKYLRYLRKKFPQHTVNGIPPRPEILKLQVLNDDFVVEAEMDLPEGYSLSKRVSNGIYLQKFDDERRELRVFKFDWKQIGHPNLAASE